RAKAARRAAPRRARVSRARSASPALDHQDDPLDRPERPERANDVRGEELGGPWPMHLEDLERANQQQDQGDEGELTDLDTDVEREQRERDLGSRQPERGKAAR